MKNANNYLQKHGIHLRKARMEDTEAIFKNVWSDADAATYMYWQPTKTAAEASSRMERTIAFEEVHPQCYFVALSESNEAIGFAGMMESAPGEYTDAGVCIARAYRRRGYGRACVELLMQQAFEELAADRFIYKVMAGNAPSLAMAHSLGFIEIGSEAIVRPSDGAPETVIRLAMSRAVYFSRKG